MLFLFYRLLLRDNLREFIVHKRCEMDDGTRSLGITGKIFIQAKIGHDESLNVIKST